MKITRHGQNLVRVYQVSCRCGCIFEFTKDDPAIKLCRAQNEGDYYYETWEGCCPKCNKSFYWDEIYNFSHCDNLEEAKELE